MRLKTYPYSSPEIMVVADVSTIIKLTYCISQRLVKSVTNCSAVLILLLSVGGIFLTLYFSFAISPPIRIAMSRPIVSKTNHVGISSFVNNKIIRLPIKILSAIGSSISPKRLDVLNRLARKPSNPSLMPAHTIHKDNKVVSCIAHKHGPIIRRLKDIRLGMLDKTITKIW